MRALIVCPNGTKGETIELAGLFILLPAQPPEKEILGYGKPDDLQLWERAPVPTEMSRIKSMDEWAEMPESLEKSFVHISRSFAVGVRAFGFSIKVFLHILRAGTT